MTNHVRTDLKPLPIRGNRVASRWLVAGTLVYPTLAILFSLGSSTNVLALVGLGPSRNYTIFSLIALGVVVWLAALYIVFTDLGLLRREEEDIQWVFDHGQEGLPYVTVPASDRSRMLMAGEEPDKETHRIETLVDERVRRMRNASLTGSIGVISIEEMRIHAEQNTARYGSFARYASTLLLLLAVLGTFAGVKTALPDLVEAIGSNPLTLDSSSSSTDIPPDLSVPLEKVSLAFGGNALALIGAISVGIMAQGLARGRRNLLERLEVVSAEFIYSSRFTQTSNPIDNAVQALRGAVDELKGSTGAMVAMRARMDSLATDFKSGFDALGDQLHDILERHETGLYDRTSHALDDLQMRVGELATVVDANTRVYAGIIDQVGERSEEAQVAIKELRKTNEVLSKAMDGMLRLGVVAGTLEESVKNNVGNLESNAKQIERESTAVRAALEALVPAVGELTRTADNMAGELEGKQLQAVRAWEVTAETLSRDMAGAIAELVKPAPKSGDGREVQLLEQISRELKRLADRDGLVAASIERHRGGVFLTAAFFALIGGGVALLFVWLV